MVWGNMAQDTHGNKRFGFQLINCGCILPEPAVGLPATPVPGLSQIARNIDFHRLLAAGNAVVPSPHPGQDFEPLLPGV
jgi:hypothetical protein